MLIQPAFLVSPEEISEIVKIFQISRRTTVSAQEVNIGVINTINHSVFVAISCVLDHIVSNDPSCAGVVVGTISKSGWSVRGIFWKGNFASVCPINVRNIKRSTMFILTSSSQVTIGETFTQTSEASTIEIRQEKF